MNRRDFLKGAVATTAALIVPSVNAKPVVDELEGCYSTVSVNSEPSFSHGAIWIDTTNGLPGSEIGVNGTPISPVNNIEDARKLMAKTGITTTMRI